MNHLSRIILLSLLALMLSGCGGHLLFGKGCSGCENHFRRVKESRRIGEEQGALASGDIERVTELIDSNPHWIKKPRWNKYTPFAFGGELDHHEGYFGDPLYVATIANQPEVVKLLIKRGANINSTKNKPRRETPLHAAASSYHTEIVKILLANGADVSKKDGDRETVLVRLTSSPIAFPPKYYFSGFRIGPEPTYDMNGSLIIPSTYQESKNEIIELLIAHGAK